MTESKNMSQDDSEKNPSQDDASEKTKKKRRSLSAILNLSQYMRQDNEIDVELIEKLNGRIEAPEGWEIEEHLDDFRPGYWYRNGRYIVQYYAVMGALAVVLCIGPEKKEGEGQEDLDGTMITPLIPAMQIPYEDENKEEDWDNAAEKANMFFQQIIDYIKENDSTFEGGDDEEKLEGGKGDGRPDSDFDEEQLKAGIAVEKEHTDDPEEAKEIAKDHLTEDPAYYQKLKKMEGGDEGKSSKSSKKSKKSKDADEEIKGGLGDGRPDSDFDQEQLQAGMAIEMEHTDDPDKAKEIAKDHLTEDPDYYKKLKKTMDEKPRKSKFRKAQG